MDIQYVITDLDGTLLDSQKNISDINIRAISEIKKTGVKIIIATSRTLDMTKRYVDELVLDKTDFVICQDGQLIYNGKMELLYKGRCLQANDIRDINKLLHPSAFFLFCKEQSFFYYRNFLRSIVMCFIQKKYRPYKSKEEICVDTMRVTKWNKQCCKKIDTIKNIYSVHVVEGKYLDIKTKDSTKFDALKYLEDNYKVILDKTIYFGDDMNDEECFVYLKNCIAMGNACKKIKEIAKRITLTNDEHGVAHVLSEYLKDVN